jgi:hypothetical protein
VAQALLRMLANCVANVRDEPERWAAIEEQARLIVEAAERRVAQVEDLVVVRRAAESLRQTLGARHQAANLDVADQPADRHSAFPIEALWPVRHDERVEAAVWACCGSRA